jgi:hypothetical protein
MQNPENLTPPSVSDMVRLTGVNTNQFMEQVAQHIDKLEAQVVTLKDRISELESKQNESK